MSFVWDWFLKPNLLYESSDSIHVGHKSSDEFPFLFGLYIFFLLGRTWIFYRGCQCAQSSSIWLP